MSCCILVHMVYALLTNSILKSASSTTNWEWYESQCYLRHLWSAKRSNITVFVFSGTKAQNCKWRCHYGHKKINYMTSSLIYYSVLNIIKRVVCVCLKFSPTNVETFCFLTAIGLSGQRQCLGGIWSYECFLLVTHVRNP